MLLTIDVGNTNIVIGAFEEKTLLFESCIKTELVKTEYEYAVLLKDVLSLHRHRPEELEGGIVASVVPQLTQVIGKAVRLLKKINVLYVGPGLKTGLNIKLDDPSQLGADVAATAVGVVEKYPLPALVINMDTATSFTLVDKNKCLRGGSIMPGILTGLAALVGKAARLSSISLEGEVELVGANTAEAMRSGTILGAASMVDGMIDRYMSYLGEGEQVFLLASGPMADLIIPFCNHEIVVDQGVLMEGMCAIYYKNRKEKPAGFGENTR